MLCFLVPGTLCYCKDKIIVLESLNLLFTNEVDLFSLFFLCCFSMMTVEAQSDRLYSYEVSHASITCQFRKQDAYYVLQGLGVDMRDTAWMWLKVKYVSMDIYTEW